MRSLLFVSISVVLFLVGCVKPPNELEVQFWDPEMEVLELGSVLDSSYVINSTNQRYYTVMFSIDWDRVPEPREGSIVSVLLYNNGVSVPLQAATAYRPNYTGYFFADPAATTCLSFGFLSSTGGITRSFELLCVQVP